MRLGPLEQRRLQKLVDGVGFKFRHHQQIRADLPGHNGDHMNIQRLELQPQGLRVLGQRCLGTVVRRHQRVYIYVRTCPRTTRR